MTSVRAHFSNRELSKWVTRLASALCGEIYHKKVAIAAGDDLERSVELSMKSFVQFLQFEEFMFYWINSPNFRSDLESLFFVGLPTDRDLESAVGPLERYLMDRLAKRR